MDVISYNWVEYPVFQAEGNAAQFAIPYARKVCEGVGFDIGCKHADWAFPGAIPIDKVFNDEWHAMNLPDIEVDYIFSSHCLEHLDDWVAALEYWDKKLDGGVLFLYLPDYSQEYWRPWHNRKHKHVLTPRIIKDWMHDHRYDTVFASGVDLNNSFMVMGDKS